MATEEVEKKCGWGIKPRRLTVSVDNRSCVPSYTAAAQGVYKRRKFPTAIANATTVPLHLLLPNVSLP